MADIKIVRMGWGAMTPLPSFTKDLKLINRKFYPLWNGLREFWMIVKDPEPQAPLSHKIRGYTTEFVVEKDGRYAPLDRRVLKALRRAMYFKRNTGAVSLGHFLKEIDREEQERVRKAQEERRLRFKDGANKINKFMKTMTFT